MAQQIKKKFIGSDQVDGSKILLEVGQTIRQKDGLGGEIDVIQSLEDSISDEQTRAEAAESALDGRLTTAEGEIDQLQLDVVSNLSTAQAYTDQKIADLVDSAPALLDTLNELAAALGDDPNFVTTVTNLVAGVQSDIDQEILDRQSADTTLQSNIDAEESRALAAEGVLQGNINTVSANLAQEILDRQADVDAEESRALAAEQLLEDGIDAIGMMIPLIEANITAIDDAKVNRTGDTITGPLVFPDSMNPSNTTTVGFGNIQVTVDDGAGVYYDASHGIDVILNKNDSNTQINHYAEIAADGISLYNDDGNGGPQSAFIPTNDFQVTTKKYVDDEIAALSSGGVAAVQSELDSTQVGAGLGTDGSYTAPVGSNYLGSAVSLKDADSKLDAQIKVVADDLAQEILDRAADVDAEQSRAEAAEAALDAAIDAVADDVSHLVTLSGVAVDSDNLGSFTGSTIADNQTIKQALQALETAHEEVDQNANDLISLSGVAENSVNLGSFSGSTIADNQTIKAALQDLETAHEAHLNDSLDAHDASAISFSNTASGLTATDVQAAIDEVEARVQTLEEALQPTWTRQKFDLTATDISNGYVDLAQNAIGESIHAFVDRLAIHQGEDFTISVVGGVTRITFAGDLVAPGQSQLDSTDNIYVRYQYLA